jgi:hypothetical protein
MKQQATEREEEAMSLSTMTSPLRWLIFIH